MRKLCRGCARVAICVGKPAIRTRRSGLCSACRRSNRRSLRLSTRSCSSSGNWPDGTGVRLDQRERDAPYLIAPLAVEIVEEFAEARDQIRLGEQRINRNANAQASLELLDASPDRRGMGRSFGRGRVGDVAECDRHDDAVQGLARPRPAQQIEERIPARAIDGGVGILGGIAAGGIDQHGVLGEPPVAKPGAADARHGALAHLGGQREFQAAVQQRRRLAGARRPDDGVPGLLVEVAARAPRFLQQGQGRGHPLPERRRFLSGAVIGLLGSLLGHAAFELPLAAAVKEIERQVRRRPDQQQANHDRQPRHPILE